MSSILLTVALSITACAAPMSTEEAGERYLEIICPANAASEVLSAAYDAQDLEAIKAAAAVRIDAIRLAANQFTADDAGWPTEVSPDDIEAISDYFMASVSGLEAVKDATALSETLVRAPDATEFQTATQTIRLTLGLPSDTTCAD